MDQLDDFDRAILTIIQEDATLAYADIGERVNLSASATLRRVQRMKENGTIIATRAILEPERVGQLLTILVEVSLENEHAATLEGTKRALIDDPQVLQCYYVTGDADLFVILAMPNMSSYKAFTDCHFLGNANIKKFKTSVVMDCVKRTTAYLL
ncbi:Lrp/AsnC family transcriptional regulator [Sphingorhabdus sp.]|uniref:Lrp/AsnC family transcriptional regulator n=1 Tax=Sphingorhabdus sp. TaxID=1902408 RepID=UPI0032B7CE62